MHVVGILELCFIIFIFNFCDHSVLSSGDLCSEDDVCSADGTRRGDDSLDKCCQPCLCTNNCSLGQCCPDVSEFVESGAECKHQLEFLPHFDFNGYIKMLDGLSGTSYYVISKCPSDTPLTHRIECEHTVRPGDNKYVHDAATYTIYKNEMCARCNGVTMYVKWRVAIPALEAEVQNILDNANVGNKEIDDEMVVLSVPPLDYPENLNVCNRNAIRSCNVTGQWDLYDANLVQLCNLSQLTPAFSYSLQYRNIYCYLCNVRVRVPSDRFTGAKCTYRPRQPNKDNLPSDMMQLLVLISYDETTISDVIGRSNDDKCPDIKEFKSACLNVICPIGQYYVEGECAHGRLERLLMKVEVEIILEFDSVAAVNNVVEFIQVNVLSHLKFDESHCVVDFYGLKQFTYVRSEYRLCILVKTTDTCRIGTLLKIVRDFEKQFFTPKMIQISTSEVVFVQASISASESRGQFDTDDWMYKEESRQVVDTRQAYVKLKPKYYCASITYSPNETRIALGESVANAMMLASEAYQEDTNRTNPANHATRIICVSAYRHILIEHGLFNSGTRTTQLFSIFVIIQCLIACYVVPMFWTKLYAG